MNDCGHALEGKLLVSLNQQNWSERASEPTYRITGRKRTRCDFGGGSRGNVGARTARLKSIYKEGAAQSDPNTAQHQSEQSIKALDGYSKESLGVL
jgi:hypothetical protein